MLTLSVFSDLYSYTTGPIQVLKIFNIHSVLYNTTAYENQAFLVPEATIVLIYMSSCSFSSPQRVHLPPSLLTFRENSENLAILSIKT